MQFRVARHPAGDMRTGSRPSILAALLGPDIVELRMETVSRLIRNQAERVGGRPCFAAPFGRLEPDRMAGTVLIPEGCDGSAGNFDPAGGSGERIGVGILSERGKLDSAQRPRSGVGVDHRAGPEGVEIGKFDTHALQASAPDPVEFAQPVHFVSAGRELLTAPHAFRQDRRRPRSRSGPRRAGSNSLCMGAMALSEDAAMMSLRSIGPAIGSTMSQWRARPFQCISWQITVSGRLQASCRRPRSW